jgi:hypothetical protein
MTVSRYIGAMLVLWLRVPDPGTRAYVEQNSIALTSQLIAARPRLARALRHAPTSPARTCSTSDGCVFHS